MPTSAKEHYLAWLRDAHAMEMQALTLIDAQVSRLQDDYPELASRLTRHRAETERQADQLQTLLDRHRAEVSMFKDMAARMSGSFHAAGSMMSSDEPVKDGLMSFAFEQMEIASYQCLIAAADVCGDQPAIPVFQAILAEEREMAGWLEENLAMLTKRFLNGADQESYRAGRTMAG